MQVGGSKRKIHNEINITPLTDVFLVLLIIMMLLQTSARLKFAGEISPPEVSGAESVKQAEQNCIIEITGKGEGGAPEKISIDKLEITAVADLEQPLRSKAAAAEKAKLLLRADKDASSAIVLDVIDTVQRIAGESDAESTAFKFLSTLTISVESVPGEAAATPESPELPAPATETPATAAPGAAS